MRPKIGELVYWQGELCRLTAYHSVGIHEGVRVTFPNGKYIWTHPWSPKMIPKAKQVLLELTFPKWEVAK